MGAGTITLALALLAALVFLALSLGLVWMRQERIVFQPPPPPGDASLAHCRARYRAADGQELLAYVIGEAEGAAGVLVAFHGNADLAVWQSEWAEEVVRRTGWVVLLAEYRGYGGLGGAPTYVASRLDARAAWDYARERLGPAPGAPPARMALFGHSLGSAIATELASEARPDVLILQAPFTSARDMARIFVSATAHRAWRLISRVHFDTETRVRALEVPVWVTHGTRDFVVPVRMGRRVFETARVQGELLLVPGAGHNDVAAVAGDAYWEWITAALGASRATARRGLASGE